MKLGVDIDDVLYPWFATAEALCEKAGITNGKKASSWHMWKDYGCPKDEWVKVLNDGTVSGDLYSAKIDPSVRGGLLMLEDNGHEVHLITARGLVGDVKDLVRKHTVDWLYYNDVPHTSLTFNRDKAMVMCDLYIDDGVHNVKRLIAAKRATVLMDAPHNQSFTYPLRARDFGDFVSYVEWYSGGWAKTPGQTPPIGVQIVTPDA